MRERVHPHRDNEHTRIRHRLGTDFDPGSQLRRGARNSEVKNNLFRWVRLLAVDADVWFWWRRYRCRRARTLSFSLGLGVRGPSWFACCGLRTSIRRSLSTLRRIASVFANLFRSNLIDTFRDLTKWNCKKQVILQRFDKYIACMLRFDDMTFGNNLHYYNNLTKCLEPCSLNFVKLW